jgi:hypothetical protein
MLIVESYKDVPTKANGVDGSMSECSYDTIFRDMICTDIYGY